MYQKTGLLPMIWNFFYNHNRVKRVSFILILISVFTFFSSSKVHAYDCDMLVSPSTTTRETSTDYSFSVMGANLPGAGVRWVKITRPSADFTVTGGSASSWSATAGTTDVTFTSASQIQPVSFSVTALSGTSDAASANWTVQMSQYISGSSPITCTGSLGTSISGSSGVTPSPTATPTTVPDTTAPTISNIIISGVSDSSVTVSWDTNEAANAVINYGATTAYGSSSTDSTMATSRSLSLTGLSQNTTYHGKIQSSDASGNTATSSDFTFATSQTVVVTPEVTTTTVEVQVEVNVTTLITPTATPTPLPDTTPPKVKLTTDLSAVFPKAPVIEGVVTDNEEVTSIEYSSDDGANWSTVEMGNSKGETKVPFSFTPLLPGEGNYSIKVKAVDGNNNPGYSESQTLIIDRLPPAVGGSFFSSGVQILRPNDEGNFTIVLGMKPKLTVSAIGGPTTIELFVNDQPTSMIQNVKTGLWSAQLQFSLTGKYTLRTHAVDGANNETDKNLPTVTVVSSGTISNAGGPINGARVVVYYFDTQYRQFHLWNAKQYGQENPQLSDILGQYSLFLPPGTYYIEITGPFSQSVKTSIFSLQKNTPITQDFFLRRTSFLSFNNSFFPTITPLSNNVMMNVEGFEQSQQMVSSMVGKLFPGFHLGNVSNTDLTGEPKVVSVLARWLPQTATQMSILSQLNDSQKKQSLVIMSQESAASTAVFTKQGRYAVSVIADPDGVLVLPLHITSLPTHFFLNRKGVITKVVNGVMSKSEIEAGLQESLQ